MSMTRTVYSAKLKEALDEIRPAFRELGHNLETMTRKRAELAPAFAKAFTIWRRETHRPFVQFVAALDPTMPADRKAYRQHPAYRAAQYLQQLAQDGAEKSKRRGLTPLGMLAVTIKSVLPLCGNQKEQKEALQVLLAATKWRDVDQTRLLAAIRRAKPVGLPNAPRLVAANKATKAVVLAFERERTQERIAS